MTEKSIGVGVMVLIGVYFLLFHSTPFPLSHDVVGLPPHHIIHSIFGAALLFGAGYIWKNK